MLNNSMTIYDLIESLQEMAEEYGEDTIVVASSDYGDHSHTEQLIEITEVSAVNPVRGAYSHSGYIYPTRDPEEYGNKHVEEAPVIVLRGV